MRLFHIGGGSIQRRCHGGVERALCLRRHRNEPARPPRNRCRSPMRAPQPSMRGLTCLRKRTNARRRSWNGFHRGLRGHGHERWSVNIAVGGVNDAGATISCAASFPASFSHTNFTDTNCLGFLRTSSFNPLSNTPRSKVSPFTVFPITFAPDKLSDHQ